MTYLMILLYILPFLLLFIRLWRRLRRILLLITLFFRHRRIIEPPTRLRFLYLLIAFITLHLLL